MAGLAPPSLPSAVPGSTLTARLTDSVGSNVRTLVLTVNDSTARTAAGTLQALAGDLLTLTTTRANGSRVSHEPQVSVDTNHLEAQWVAGDGDQLSGSVAAALFYGFVGSQASHEYATINANTVAQQQAALQNILYFEPTFPTALSEMRYNLCVPCRDASWDGRGSVNIFGQSASNSGVAQGTRPAQFHFLGYAAEIHGGQQSSRAMYGVLDISFPASVSRMQWNVGLQTTSNRQSNVFWPFPFAGTDVTVGVEVARSSPTPLQLSPLSVFARSTVTLPLARSELGPAGYRQAYDLTGAKRGVGVAFP